MAKTLQFDNSSVLYDATEAAELRIPNSIGSNITLTVDDNSDLAQNDYILFGKVGQPKSEIALINAAVAAGTSIQVDSLTFVHEAGTPITKINYNQVEISRATTTTGGKSVLTTVALDADNIYTSYRDTVNSTGYAFYRLKNSTTSVFSGYSAPYDYATAGAETVEKIKFIVRKLYEKSIDETLLDMMIDAVAQEIYSIRFWKFRETSVSFNSVASTASYSLATAGATDMSVLVYATYNGDPVWPTNVKKYQAQNWNVSATGNPSSVLFWNGTLYFTPAPSAVQAIVLWYYKNHTSFASNVSTTEMELPSAIAYGVLRDLWGPKSKSKADFYNGRYIAQVTSMKNNDKKDTGIFQELTETMSSASINDQVRFPNPITAAV